MKSLSQVFASLDGARQRVVLSGVSLGASHLIRAGTRAAYLVILARYLGPEAFGLLNYGMGWYLAFLSLTYLGLDMIISREAWEEGQRSREIVSATLPLLAAAVVVAASLSFAAAFLVEQGEAAKVLALFTLALVGRSIATWTTFVLVAKGRSKRVLAQDSSCRIGEAVIGGAAVLLGGSLTLVVTLHAASWWLQSVVGLRSIRILSLFDTPTGIWAGLKILGLRPFVLGLAGAFQVWITQAPIVLFRLMGGHDGDLGRIGLAFQIFGLVAGVSWMTVRAVLPDLSRNITAGGTADETVVRFVVPNVLLLTAGLVAATMIFGEGLIVALVGAEYAGTAALLPLAVAASGAYTIAVCGHQILAVHRRDGRIFVGTLIGAAATMVVIVGVWPHAPLLAPYLGLAAGVLSWVVAVMWSLRLVTSFSPARVIGGPFIVGGAVVVAAALLQALSPIIATTGVVLVMAVGLWITTAHIRNSSE